MRNSLIRFPGARPSSIGHDAALPGHALAGSRRNAGVTQLQLARVTGIPQRHVFRDGTWETVHREGAS